MRAPGTDTIFAAASGTSRAAVTVVRLSGPASGDILRGLCGQDVPTPRLAGLRRLRDRTGETLDRAIVLWFPGPKSYTGEDAAELHLHGGRAVLDAVGAALGEFGARPADPGEFTRRAFLNGKCDLLEAEAIADLVDAETQAQRRQAMRQLDGALGALYRGWIERLTVLLARQEALIDFPDDDLPPDLLARGQVDIASLAGEIQAHLSDGSGEQLRDGLVFAVSGAPNAGKSSLVNALAGRDIAIVAATPGTTRDVLETRVVLGDVPVTLLDTAGLRETDDPIEAEGVRRARARADGADLVIQVIDAASGPCGIDAREADDTARRAIVVYNKVDIAPAPVGHRHAVSARTGAGLDVLRGRLDGIARELTRSTGTAPLTRARHRIALTRAGSALEQSRRAAAPELCAEDLRIAIRELGRVTGHVGVETILDAIFSRFCIGK
jgi:tRNA modification GTPase